MKVLRVFVIPIAIVGLFLGKYLSTPKPTEVSLDSQTKILINQQITRLRNTGQCYRVLKVEEEKEESFQMKLTDFIGKDLYKVNSQIGSYIIKNFEVNRIIDISNGIKFGNLRWLLQNSEDETIIIEKNVPILFKRDEKFFYCNTFMRKLL